MLGLFIFSYIHRNLYISACLCCANLFYFQTYLIWSTRESPDTSQKLPNLLGIWLLLFLMLVHFVLQVRIQMSIIFCSISWARITKMATNPIANYLMNLLWRVANNANHQMVESSSVEMHLWRTAISVTLTKELLTCLTVCLLMWKSKSIYRAFACRCRIWLVCRKTFLQCHLFI